MKKLVLIGSALFFMPLGAIQEKVCTEPLKQATDRFIEKVKTVSVGLYNRVMPENKKSFFVSTHRPVIVESCEHCRNLCDESMQSKDLV